MRKQIMRLIFVLLLAVLLPGLVTEAEAATITHSGYCGANVTWTLDSNGLLTISGTGDMADYVYADNLTNYYGAAPWNSLWDPDDWDWEHPVRSVVVEYGVTSIGDWAFLGCYNMSSITISGSVTRIGEDAFHWCSSLSSITIPGGVTSIGDDAFYGCESLSSITLLDGITRIDDGAFSGCTSLSSISIPGSVTRIGDSAFSGCTSLSSISIPGSVTRIGDSAFSRCTSLSSISIPGSVTRIGAYAFSNCDSLTAITIPEGVVHIGDYIFFECDNLGSITLPDSLTSIGSYAFYGCTGLNSILIPAGVTSIGERAFSGCANLYGIWVAYENQTYASDARGVLFSKNGTWLIEAPGAISGAYSVPNGVTYIEDGAFSGCTGLNSVTIPGSVTSIGWSAFSGCTGLNSVTVSEDISYLDIGWSAFHGCTSLGSITLPEGVTDIGDSAFNKCTALRSVTLPASIHSIDESAFYDCPNLTIVHYGGTAEQKADIWLDDNNWDLEDAVWHYECSEATCSNPFTDIATNAYYYEPVLWAIDQNITKGTGPVSFAPADTCTRGQIVTFLWRSCGSPEPKSGSNPFWDVNSSDYFYKAVLWAVENGITSGMGDGSFAPGAPCTRGQVATFLWRSEGQPASGGNNIFTDIASGAYYYEPVLWAVEKGITNGVGEGLFAPDATCTRGQIVTFLYRAMDK